MKMMIAWLVFLSVIVACEVAIIGYACWVLSLVFYAVLGSQL